MSHEHFLQTQVLIANKAGLPTTYLGPHPNAELLKVALTKLSDQAATHSDFQAFHFYYNVNARICAAQGKTSDVEGIRAYTAIFPAAQGAPSGDTERTLWDEVRRAYKAECAIWQYED